MKKALSIIDIITPIILLIILLFAKLSENTVIVITLTLFIGWVIPFFINIITGIILLKNSHQRLGLIANLLNIILTLILIILVIRIMDKGTMIFLIEYIILIVLSILNYISLRSYLKNHPSKSKLEKNSIKEKKKKNNGAIV
jgi:amino acid transporter